MRHGGDGSVVRLLVVGAVCVYWKWITAGVAAWLGAKWVRQAHAEFLATKAAAAAERAAIIAGADEQDRQVLRGDKRGVHGDYPPAAGLLVVIPSEGIARRPPGGPSLFFVGSGLSSPHLASTSTTKPTMTTTPSIRATATTWVTQCKC